MGEAAEAPGRPPAARRRRLLRVAALLTGATMVTGLLQATEATSSRADTGTGSRTATVTLNDITPRVPTSDSTVTVSGTVTNNGKTTISGAHLGVRIGPGGPLTTRSAMKSAASRSGFISYLDGDEITGHTVEVAKLPAGYSAAFTLKVPVSALNLTATGVYQFGVALDGETAADASEHVLGINRTFLPWYATDAPAKPKPTQISYLWPLTDRPHIAARGDTDSQQSPIFLDDDLAKELAPGGRLQQMVELAKNLPVTWVIDPDLLATVDSMTKPYRVVGPGGDVHSTTPGTGSAVANQWLNDLKGAIVGDQVVALPFGDTDLASIGHHGVSGTLAHLKTATALGASTVQTVLGTALGTKPPTANVAWPIDGAVDPSIVAVARKGGASKIIASSDSIGESGLDYTPTAARPIGGGTTAVVADAMLSTAFTGDMLRAQPANLAEQNFLAQTLMITMQAPEKQRTLLVAPQRQPTISQAQVMADAISTADSSPWAATVDFDVAAKATPDARANHQVPPTSAYPRSLRKQELPTDAFPQIQETQRRLNEFAVILTRKDRVTVPFGNAVLRSMSNGWRGDPQSATDFRDAIGGYLTDLIGAVHILDKTTLTLSGRSGTIPVTVKNELGQPIKGLVLRLTSHANIRLEIKNAKQPIAIDGGHTRTLKFQTSASANGAVMVEAGLYHDNGSVYGQAIDFEVHINKVTDLVMLIIGAGLLLLVLAGVRIYRQRKKLTAAEGDEDEEGGDEPDHSDPEHPGDPGADTDPESTEPSPTGEKVDG
ncbi:DUF6049 family protein [Streptomyces sp. NPDC051976]|uniref:DUF6049 family protein n=1 Tax=Streptomyces sp. NPDC051976 TaxID=3154947 RepID=UPI003435F036